MDMKLHLTRNEAAKLLGVTPQTITNYLAKGLLVESMNKGKKNPQMRILSSSVKRLLDEGFDIPKQSNAIDELRKELRKEEETLRIEKAKLRERIELAKSGTAFMKNIREVSEILSSYVASNAILSRREKSILTDILSGRNLAYIAEKNELCTERIRQIYNRTLRILELEKNHSAEKLINENEALRLELKNEREKAEALEKKLEEFRRTPCKKNGLIRIPVSLTGRESMSHLSTRTYNALRFLEIENLYELALIKRDMLSGLRNFGDKSMDEIVSTMSVHGIRFNDINSLCNVYIASRKGPFIDISIYQLEERQRKLTGNGN